MTVQAGASPTSPPADVLESFFETKTACDVEGTVVGITALELDPEGLITRITSVHDSRQLDPARMDALANACFAK